MSSIGIYPSTIRDDILMKYWDHKKLRIPDYQRNYVWNDEKVDEFWHDLTERKISLPFLGSFILKEEEDSNKKTWYTIIDIVDWQQRTITIALFLSALRNAAKKHNLEWLANTIQWYLQEPDWLGWYTEHYYLECWTNVQSFFKDNILSYEWDMSAYKWKIKRTQESMRNMQKNYIEISQKIEELLAWKDDATAAISLRELLQKILDYEIVIIKVKSDEEAYIAFEIVNAWWVKLENIDLLKNLFIKESSKLGMQEEIKKRWWEMTENIIESNTKWNIESFLKHFWSARKWYILGKDLYVAFKKLLANDNVDEVSKHLLEDSYMYQNFWSPEWIEFIPQYAYNSQIIESLNALSSFSVSQAYILFLTILRYKEEIWWEKYWRRIRNIFKLTENFHFIYSAICKLQANKVEKLYCNHATNFVDAVKKCKDMEDSERSKYMGQMFDLLKRDIKALLDTNTNKEDFINKFTNLTLKSTNKDIIRYILTQYELCLSSWWTIPNFAITNIEHIYPQNESKQTEKNNLINNIWNLMLLEKDLNSECGNEPLEKKIPIYEKNTTYKQVEEIVNSYKQWDIEHTRSEKCIQERANKIANTVYNNIMEQINNM